MAIYVYNTSTGALYSWSPNDTDPVADSAALTAAGLTAVSGLAAIGASAGTGLVYAWDAEAKTVSAVASPVMPKWIATYLFVNLFTDAEHTAILTAATPGQASFDPKVSKFMMMVQTVQQINLNDTLVQAGIDYLASINLLTSANAALILSGQASQ